MVVAQRPSQASLRDCIPPKVLEVWGTIFSLMTLRKSPAQGQLTDASNCSFLVWLRAWCSSHGHVGCQSPGAGKGPPWVTGWGHPWLSCIQEPGPPYRIASHAPSGEAAEGWLWQVGTIWGMDGHVNQGLGHMGLSQESLTGLFFLQPLGTHGHLWVNLPVPFQGWAESD